jgi:hypothetical protein
MLAAQGGGKSRLKKKDVAEKLGDNEDWIVSRQPVKKVCSDHIV